MNTPEEMKKDINASEELPVEGRNEGEIADDVAKDAAGGGICSRYPVAPQTRGVLHV